VEKSFKATYHNKHLILDNKKLAKFLTKFAFFDKHKEKWKLKALELFWQDLTEGLILK